MLLASRWMGHLWLILVVIAGLSFALAVYLALTTAGVSFYLFPTRIWELMAGAILAVLEYRRGQGRAVICCPASVFCSCWCRS
ncbi:MAG: hypothetical protein ISP91_04915 [Pseudomonadales bacterium]|nr:hypothetical protein [Pseudomonadales bacterium]